MNNKCFGCKNESCKILYVEHCDGMNQNCHFYATADDVFKGRRAVFDTLSSRPLNVQTEIANKYYNGEMPWRRAR